jgi:hypothetical protein
MNDLIVTAKSVNHGRQDISLNELLNYGEHRLRLIIKSDSYKSQCYARLEAFDKSAMKWNIVVYRPHGDMQTEEGLVYSRLSDVHNEVKFQSDRAWLIAQFKNLMD